jgi:hypothetical protein
VFTADFRENELGGIGVVEAAKIRLHPEQFRCFVERHGVVCRKVRLESEEDIFFAFSASLRQKLIKV